MLQATDLVAVIGEHVALRQQGREFVGLCPFHDDRSPSLHVVVHKGAGFYKCFACGAAGNAIDFLIEHLGMDFPTALRVLAQRAGITLTPPPRRAAGEVDRSAVIEANELALAHWRRLLATARSGRSSNAAARAAAAALAERGISDEQVERFALGVAADSWDDLTSLVKARQLDQRAFVAAGLIRPRQKGDEGGAGRSGAGGHYDFFRNRIIFPICDEAGRPIAFGGRRLDPNDERKYLNSAESAVFSKSRTLYGLHLARRAIMDANTALVTEGYTDVIACHQAGFRHAVATLGTALTLEHARILRRLCERVILLFDGDEAGQKAADHAAEVFFAEPVDVLVCVIPDGRDPDELLRLPDGPERFRAALEGTRPVLDFLVARFAQEYRGAATMSGREKRLEAFLDRLVQLGLGAAKEIRRRFVLERLAELIGLPISTLEAAMRGRPAARLPGPRVEVSDPHADAQGQAAAAGMPSDPPAPPALVKAEAALLGLLLRHPELSSQRIDAGEGHLLPVLELHPSSSYLDPGHREVAACLEALLDEAEGEGHLPSMQVIMAEVARPELRVLASSLYLAAERRTGGTLDSAIAMLPLACADLDAARRRFGLRIGLLDMDDATSSEASPAGADAAQDASLAAAARHLERLRRRGHDPAAFVPFARP